MVHCELAPAIELAQVQTDPRQLLEFTQGGFNMLKLPHGMQWKLHWHHCVTVADRCTYLLIFSILCQRIPWTLSHDHSFSLYYMLTFFVSCFHFPSVLWMLITSLNCHISKTIGIKSRVKALCPFSFIKLLLEQCRQSCKKDETRMLKKL